MTYQNVNIFYSDHEDALYSRKNKKYFIAEATEPDNYKQPYYAIEYARPVVNINYFNGLLDDSYRELRNYSSVNEFLLSDKESIAIKNILVHSQDMISKLNVSYWKTFNELDVNSEVDSEDIGQTINNYMIEYESSIEEYLEKDLLKLNQLINHMDNLFRKEFDTQ
ncbi:hypothetical protein ACFPFV_09320 [Salinicoccus siamensis]|uniref:Uncharacterized protein n=1 Tax=Salinicoccus siamensis TaxID=381830 RepID=A0ABV5Z6B3_9STAP